MAVGPPNLSDPIGSPPFDIAATIMSQYAAAPILTTLVAFFEQWFDATTPIDNWFDDVWNVDTAKGWGLDVWGRIVGVGRTLVVAPSRYLGFEEGGTLDYDPFGQSPFYQFASSGNFVLSDDAYRQLILAKAAANICDGTISGINALLFQLFGATGAAYIQDNGDMTVTYVFLFVPTPVQNAIITQSGVLPRPTGCGVTYQVL